MLLSVFRRAISTCPITLACLVVAIGLFAATVGWRIAHPESKHNDLRTMGAVNQLTVFRNAKVKHPQLNGPFDLWQGEWWRLPVTAFHHADPVQRAQGRFGSGFLHLVANCLALGWLGWWVEPRISRLTFASFLGVAAVGTLIPDLLIEKNAFGVPAVAWLVDAFAPFTRAYDVFGLDGAVGAMFGLFIVQRDADDDLAEAVPEQIVWIGWGWLATCWFLTRSGLLFFPVLAQWSGLLYGWLFGQLIVGWWAQQRGVKLAFVTAHLLLLPAVYLVMHPTWTGRYHWYLAEPPCSPSERLKHLQQTVALNPGLANAWLDLAEQYGKNGDHRAAWKSILSCLNHNRSFDKALVTAKDAWRAIDRSPIRGKALADLKTVFGDEAYAWQERLGIETDRRTADVPLGDPFPLPPDNGRWILRHRDLFAPPVDPDSPESAAAGVRL